MKALRSHIRLIGAYMLVNWRTSLQYRANFIFETILSLAELGMYLFYWKIFLSIGEGIPGITFEQLAALVAFNHIIYAVADTFMGDHIWDTGDMIIRGQLDIFLVQPKSAVWQIFFSGAQPARALQIITGTILFFIVVEPSPAHVGLFCFGLIVGGSIFASWLIILQSMVFHLGNTLVVYKLLQLMLHFAKKPATIFSSAIRFVLYSIIPAAYMGTVQADQVFNPDTSTLLLLGSLGLAAPIVAVVIFHAGMRRYESGNLIGIRA